MIRERRDGPCHLPGLLRYSAGCLPLPSKLPPHVGQHVFDLVEQFVRIAIVRRRRGAPLRRAWQDCPDHQSRRARRAGRLLSDGARGRHGRATPWHADTRESIGLLTFDTVITSPRHFVMSGFHLGVEGRPRRTAFLLREGLGPNPMKPGRSHAATM
jgi:hypothetical protein